VDFSTAPCKEVNFGGANSKARYFCGRCSWRDLFQAKLRDANFDGAILKGVNLDDMLVNPGS